MGGTLGNLAAPDFHGVHLLFSLFVIDNDSRWVCHRKTAHVK